MQREELFLTAAQSFFAVAVISNLSMSLREAGILFGLFWFQFLLGGLVPESLHGVERIAVGILYLILGVRRAAARTRPAVAALFTDGLTASYEELSAERAADAAGRRRATPG